MSELQPIAIDVISDTMCPWCYIGKRRLEKALALRPHEAVSIHWRPYQLDPTIPSEGMDRKTYLENKFGGREQAKSVYEPIRQAGEDEAIPFAFDQIDRSPNTVNSHRLIRWARTGGHQDQVVEILFRRFFTEGEDIGDKDVLIEAAGEAGMDTAIVKTLLEGDADREEVEKEVALARQMGVTGVPCFIVDNKYVVVGAQTPEIIAGAIDMAVKERHSEGNGETAPDA